MPTPKKKKPSRICEVYWHEGSKTSLGDGDSGWMITYTPLTGHHSVNVLLDAKSPQQARRQAHEFCHFPMENIKLRPGSTAEARLAHPDAQQLIEDASTQFQSSELQPKAEPLSDGEIAALVDSDLNTQLPTEQVGPRKPRTSRDKVLSLAKLGTRTRDIAMELGLSMARVSTLKTQLKAAGLL